MNLEEYFLNFKNITIELVQALKSDEIDKVINLLEKREVIIGEFKKNNIKYFNKYEKEFNLMKYEKELKYLFLEKIEKIKKEMINLKKRNSANKIYSKHSNNANGFLNLKI